MHERNRDIDSDIICPSHPHFKDCSNEDLRLCGHYTHQLLITLEEMDSPALSPEAIAFAARIYDAARAGQIDLFEQALPAGLPANMTNEKGDSLVSAAGFVLMLIPPFCSANCTK